jgi:hypothetical protein
MATNHLLLVIVGMIVAVALLRVLVKLFSDPEARKIAKILLLLPLMVLGSLLLAFIVLIAAVRFWAYQPPASATVVPEGSAITVQPDGTHVRVGDLAVDVNASGKPGPAAPPARVRQETAAGGDSDIVRMYRAVKTAFAATVRSALEKKSPGGVGNAKAGQETEVAARPEPAPKQPSLAAPAAADAAGAKGAATASASPPPSAPAVATKRPDWVDNPPQPSAESYEVAVNSGPWKTWLECEQALNDEIDLAVDNYVAWQLGEEARSQVSLPEDALRHRLLAEQWLETVDTKFGEQMLNLHALLRFDSRIDSKLREAWNQLVVMGRIVGSGAILGGVLLLLAVIYGYLKISRGSPRPLRERG